MSEQNDRSKQLEDARTLARITTAWREAEEALATMSEKVQEAQRTTDYWVGECNRRNAKITKLEARIKELESPLADLARQLNTNTGDKP